MCGIAGALFYHNNQNGFDLLCEAIDGCKVRGEDSFGLLKWSKLSGWSTYKKLGFGGNGYKQFVEENTCKEYPLFYLHTSRAEPTTEWKTHKTKTDIPPFLSGEIAVAHNGIISNDSQLEQEYEINRLSSIDTAIVPELIHKKGVWEAVSLLKGGNALGIINVKKCVLYLYRNFLPLTIAWQPGAVIFASEKEFFKAHSTPFPNYRIWELPPYSAIEFSTEGYRFFDKLGSPHSFNYDRLWEKYPDF